MLRLWKPYIMSFFRKDDGVTLLEMAFIMTAVVIFLGIAIPSLLTHVGGVFTRADTKLDSFLQ